MEVRPGYKQTEVGVIPKEWEVAPLRALCTKIQDGTHFSPKIRGGEFLYVTSKNIGFGVLDVSDAPRIDSEQHAAIYRHCDVLLGDLLLTKDGANTGNAALNTLEPEFSLLSSVAFLRFDCRRHDAAFFLQQVLSWEGQRRIKDAMSGNAITRLTLEKINNLRFPYAPLPEQRAIAAALSDADALLGALDQLIAKKRYLKQAAMQQLLTGQTRLPGFRGKWGSGNLASVIGALDAGVSVNSVEDDDADGSVGNFILKTSAVAGGQFIPRECKRIAQRDLSRACLNPLKGTIIISRMNTPDLVGECGYVDRDYPNLFVPDRLWMTRFKHDLPLNGRWLSYLLSTAALKRQIGAAATGTSGSMKNLSKRAFLQIPIALPSGGEQSAIAAVLSGMDAELSALEARRDKTRALKQGMMQELLTGRTRLV